MTVSAFIQLHHSHTIGVGVFNGTTQTHQQMSPNTRTKAPPPQTHTHMRSHLARLNPTWRIGLFCLSSDPSVCLSVECVVCLKEKTGCVWVRTLQHTHYILLCVGRTLCYIYPYSLRVRVRSDRRSSHPARENTIDTNGRAGPCDVCVCLCCVCRVSRS